MYFCSFTQVAKELNIDPHLGYDADYSCDLFTELKDC